MTNRAATMLVAVLVLILAQTAVEAAQTVHLWLQADGNDIDGESSVTSMDRDNTIECLAYRQAIKGPARTGTGAATGRRTYEPIVIRKRIDKSSPRLMQALCDNQVIEGTFRFYRPNPAGDGTTEQYFTVHISGARIASISLVSPDITDPASTNTPATEEVSFVFQEITWTYAQGGVEFSDSLTGARSATSTTTASPKPPAPTTRKVVPRKQLRLVAP